jgi:hypothetical protein
VRQVGRLGELDALNNRTCGPIRFESENKFPQEPTAMCVVQG